MGMIAIGKPIFASDIMNAISNTYPEWIGSTPPIVKGDFFVAADDDQTCTLAFITLGTSTRQFSSGGLQVIGATGTSDIPASGFEGFAVNVQFFLAGKQVKAPNIWREYVGNDTSTGGGIAGAQAAAIAARDADLGPSDYNWMGMMATTYDDSHGAHTGAIQCQLRVAGRKNGT